MMSTLLATLVDLDCVLTTFLKTYGRKRLQQSGLCDRMAPLANVSSTSGIGSRLEEPAPTHRPPVQDTQRLSAGNLDIREKFRETLEYQCQVLDFFMQRDDHLLTIAGHLLDQNDKRFDYRTAHLIASILYFLKLHNYRVSHYVERLRRQVAGETKH